MPKTFHESRAMICLGGRKDNPPLANQLRADGPPVITAKGSHELPVLVDAGSVIPRSRAASLSV